ATASCCLLLDRVAHECAAPLNAGLMWAAAGLLSFARWAATFLIYPILIRLHATWVAA
ncbi:hypothetical protein Dimus_031717, partial [Dionaea muscipula]